MNFCFYFFFCPCVAALTPPKAWGVKQTSPEGISTKEMYLSDGCDGAQYLQSSLETAGALNSSFTVKHNNTNTY